MRYIENIKTVSANGEASVGYWRCILYCKAARRAQNDLFAFAREHGCIWAKTYDNGIPIACHDDVGSLPIDGFTFADIEAFRVREAKRNNRDIEDIAGLVAFEILLSIPACEALENMVGKRRPLVWFHFIDNKKLPHGMGKLGAGKPGSIKLAKPIGEKHSSPTTVYQGRTPFKPTTSAKPTTSDSVTTIVWNEDGTRESKRTNTVRTSGKKTIEGNLSDTSSHRIYDDDSRDYFGDKETTYDYPYWQNASVWHFGGLGI